MFNKEKIKNCFNIKNISFIALVLLFIFIILLVIQNHRMTKIINYYGYLFDNQMLFDKKRQDPFEEYYNSYKRDIENMKMRAIKGENNYFNGDSFDRRAMRHNYRHFDDGHYNDYYYHDNDHDRYFYDDYNDNYMDNRYDHNLNGKENTYNINNRHNNSKNRNFVYKSKTNINGKEFVVKVNLPRTFTLDNVKVDFNNNMLIIKAEQQNKTSKEDNTRSYFYNSFMERYLIPETKATIKDVKVTLDKNNELNVVVPIIGDKQNNK